MKIVSVCYLWKPYVVLFLFIITRQFAYCQKGDESKREAIRELEKKLDNPDLQNPGETYLQLSELYWKINPEKAVDYGKKAAESLRIAKPERVPYALVNVSIAYYYLGNMDSVIHYNGKIINNYSELLTTHHWGVIYNILSVAYRNKGNYDKSLENAVKSLGYFRKSGDTTRLAGVLDNMASIYRETGKYKLSLDYSLQSLRIFERLNSVQDIFIVNDNIADLYGHMKQYRKEKQYLLKCLQLSEQLDDDFFRADSYNNLGACYNHLQLPDSALDYFQQALEYYKKAGVTSGIAVATHNIGLVYMNRNDYSKGISFLLEAYEDFEQIQSENDIWEVSLDLVKAYMQTGETGMAEKYLLQTENMSKKVDNGRLRMRTLETLNEFYRETGRYPEAYKYLELYHNLKDSLNGAEVKKQIAELDKKYQTEKKENEIITLRNQRKMQNIKFRNLLFVSVGGLLFLLITSYLIIQKRKKEKAIVILENEKISMQKERLAQELEFANRQLTAQAINLMHRNKMLNRFLESLEKTETTHDKNVIRKQVGQLKKEIKQTLNSDIHWEKFEGIFAKVNAGFVRKFGQLANNITENDNRIVSLIKLGMTNKEIAVILNITTQSVKNNLYRIKKKIGLENDVSLRDFIMKM